MPINLNQLERLSIQKTYLLLERITIPKELYNPQYEYASLDKTKLSSDNINQFLAAIKNELNSSLTELLNTETINALFALEENNTLNEAIDKLRQTQETLTVEVLCKQLAEFIDLSRLLHFISIPPVSKWSLLSYVPLLLRNQTNLEKFSALIRLKFKLFQTNLLDFLTTTQEQSDLLKTIVSTLITDYLPHVAVANYPMAIPLSNYGTSAKQLQEKIETVEIPLLTKAFEAYQKRILNVVNEQASRYAK